MVFSVKHPFKTRQFEYQLVGGGAGPGCGLLHLDAQEKIEAVKNCCVLENFFTSLVSDNKMKIRWNFWLR